MSAGTKVCPQCSTEYPQDQSFCPKDGSTLRSVNAGGDLVGSIIADRYRVTKKLGEGGMGAVYLAEHVKMGRQCAVKVMNPGMASDPDAISRFNREAANASRINHPNVCAVYDFGETADGIIYLAMEFIEGPSLSKVIEDLGALPPIRAAEINRQAAEALSVAHDMGIVHRDLKPDNIMIAKGRDGSDIVKVVDFGIAKAGNAENQKVTKTGMVVGTPEYMSPEQLSGDKLDGRSDTYSLGLVAFNMLTGKLPFPGETLQETMVLRLTDRPKTLGEMKSDVVWPDGVQAVLDKALARGAADRYQSASDFGRELSAAVRAMPESEMTSAHTAMIGRVSSPKATAPRASQKTAPIPATRVNTPTPHAASPSVPEKSKSRMPMFAGLAVVILVLGAGGTWLATRPGDAAPSEQLNQQITSSPQGTPAVSIDARLARIDTLTGADATDASVIQSLADLDSLPLATMTQEQQVYAALLRAQAISYRDANDPRLCSLLRGVHEQSKQTRYVTRVALTLENACPSTP
jgi:serine/threonine protein kinase